MTLPPRDQLLVPTADPIPLVFPFVHDELEVNASLALSRAVVGSGHYCSALGWVGNGVDSRLQNVALPAWLAGSGVGVSMFAELMLGPHRTSRDLYLALTTSGDSPKLELSAIPDTSDGNQTQAAFRYGSTVVPLNRSTWRFAFRMPEQYNGINPYGQALLFLDADTLLLAVHFNDTLTALYRFDLSSGNCTGKATSTTYQHIGSLGKDSTGQVWATASLPSYVNLPIDLDTSFSTGEITAAARGLWSTPDVQTNGGITFATIGGVNYVMKIAFVTSGAGYLYVFREDQMSGTALAADRVKRFALGTYVQDIAWRSGDGKLYVSRGVSGGKIDTFDLAYALANAVDSAALTAVASHAAATYWAEGIDFHPSTDECWTSTEGLGGPGDLWQFSGAVWVSSLTGQAETNRYLVDFVAATSEYQIRINERLFCAIPASAPTAPTRLVIGGPPNASPGWKTGFMYGGAVRNLALKDRPFSSTEIASLVSHGYDAGSLTSTPVPIVNPGCESVTGSPLVPTDWTDESSGTTTRAGSSNPAPASGSHYFFAVGGLQLATQSFDLATVLATTAGYLDTLTAAGKVTVQLAWKQASYDGGSDPGGLGIIALDALGGVLATVKSAEVWTDTQAWGARGFSAQVPSGTRTLKILQHATRTAGTNLDCYRDDISAAVVVAS